MKTFKEMIQQDNQTVFLNFDEFGEYKNIDGDDVLMIVDYDLINERPHLFAEGTFQSKITFFVLESELGYVPEQNQLINFEKYPYIVSNVASDMGILEVTIEANEI